MIKIWGLFISFNFQAEPIFQPESHKMGFDAFRYVFWVSLDFWVSASDFQVPSQMQFRNNMVIITQPITYFMSTRGIFRQYYQLKQLKLNHFFVEKATMCKEMLQNGLEALMFLKKIWTCLVLENEFFSLFSPSENAKTIVYYIF